MPLRGFITALTSALVKPAFLALATKLPRRYLSTVVDPLSCLHFAGHFKTVSGSTVMSSGFTTETLQVRRCSSPSAVNVRGELLTDFRLRNSLSAAASWVICLINTILIENAA